VKPHTTIKPRGIVIDDGGRADAGYTGTAGDCVTRAIAIALQQDYETTREHLMSAMGNWIATSRSRAAKHARAGGRGRSVRNGVPKQVYQAYLSNVGWNWTPTMHIGSGCTIHLRGDELPPGRLIARVSRHLVAVVDGMIHDTSDPTRGGTRCVYGYWTQ